MADGLRVDKGAIKVWADALFSDLCRKSLINSVTNSLCEPDRWLIEEVEYGEEFCVVGFWADGTRKAYRMLFPLPPDGSELRNRVIDDCKQALRDWYRQHISRKAV